MSDREDGPQERWRTCRSRRPPDWFLTTAAIASRHQRDEAGPLPGSQIIEALRHFPDDAVIQIGISAGELRKALEKHENPDRSLSTREAAREFGRSSKTWMRWADQGVGKGAYQDRPGGIWRLPRKGCEARIEALRRSYSKPRRRGPRKRPR